MRTANYIFSATSLILGFALLLLVLSQTSEWRLRTLFWPPDWSIGTTIGVVLVINGIVRLWFAQDDSEEDE